MLPAQHRNARRSECRFSAVGILGREQSERGVGFSGVLAPGFDFHAQQQGSEVIGPTLERLLDVVGSSIGVIGLKLQGPDDHLHICIEFRQSGRTLENTARIGAVAQRNVRARQGQLHAQLVRKLRS